MAADIPLPESAPTSPLAPPTPAPAPAPPTPALATAPAPAEQALRLIVQALLPILSGQHTLLSLYQAINQFSQESACSLSGQTKELFKSLSERHDQLDQLKVCDTTTQIKLEQPPPDPPDQASTTNSEEIKIEREALQTKLKQEEEKRAKSISLLRAVRQKLVQTEKDKAVLENDLNQIKSSTSAKIEELQSDKRSLEDELSKLKIFNDQQLSKLRHSSEREIHTIRSQYERDAAAKKSQFELDTITTKAAHERELSNRNQKISHLENRLRELSTVRDKLFDRLQNTQAELEVLQAQHDEIKGSMGELKHQLNESHHRIHGLVEELDNLQKLRSSEDKSENGMEKLVQELEQQHLSKTNALQLRISQLEKERFDVEQELTDSLQERLQQIEILRTESRLKSEEYAESLKIMAKRNEEISKTDAELKFLNDQLQSALHARDSHTLMVAKLQEQLEELKNQLTNQTTQLERCRLELNESVEREKELRTENQRIRENEIKKVEEVKGLFLRGGGAKMIDQNQRKEGVGYFANFSRQPVLSPIKSSKTSPTKVKSYDDSRRSLELTDDDDRQSRGPQDQKTNSNFAHSSPHLPLTENSTSSPSPEKLTPRSATSQNNHHLDSSLENEAELNFEYLRNTLLQFLEHKEMRPHLVRVLGVILHFTPQEIRRLAAKV